MPEEASTMSGGDSRASPRPGKAHRTGCAAGVWKQFATQETPGHRTIFSLKTAIGIFSFTSLMFLVGGALMLNTSLRQVELKVDYSRPAELENFSNEEISMLLQGLEVQGMTIPPDAPLVTTVLVPVTEDMDAPVYVYYVLGDFYQNHKRYVRSVNYDQLHGESVGEASLSDCIPQRYLNDQENATFPANGLIKPCGLIAWSYFNDTFFDWQLNRPQATTTNLAVDESNLVWDTDRTKFFGNYSAENLNTVPQWRGGQTLFEPVAQDEHFMAWMRVAAHPTVRKFYGVINQDLKKGDVLSLSIAHRYNTYEFDGEKSLLITTASSFGNRNLTFGITWLIMAVLCAAITVTYVALGWHQLRHPDARRQMLIARWTGVNKASMKPSTMTRSGPSQPTFRNFKGLK